jgi:hypothetical protein
MPSITDIRRQLAVPRYAPRIKPTPIPTAAWNDTPLFCLEVNDEWLGHVLGALEVLDQHDTWVGSEDDILAVRRQVNEMMAAFMEECDPMSNCCPEPLTRVSEDGTLEVSYDGGATWADATTEDPRNTAPQLPPLGGANGTEKKCTAANNVLGQFKDGISTFEGYYDTSATVVEFVTAVAGAICAFIFAPLAVPIVVAAIIALMSAVWNVGKTAYVAAFNDTVFGDLLCILFCHVGFDGTFTQEGLDAIRADISSHFDSIASGAFLALLNGVGVAGINTMARIPTGSSASCDSCECVDSCGIMYWPGQESLITQIDECTWRFASTNESGHQAVYAWINNATNTVFDATKCGDVISWAIHSGADVDQSWNECTTGTLHLHSDPTGHCVSQLYFTSAAPFEVDVFISAC